MSDYDDDPRVHEICAGHYDVVESPSGSFPGRVAPGLHGGFVAWVGHPDEIDGPGFNTADEAIYSLIGAPQ